MTSTDDWLNHAWCIPVVSNGTSRDLCGICGKWNDDERHDPCRHQLLMEIYEPRQFYTPLSNMFHCVPCNKGATLDHVKSGQHKSTLRNKSMKERHVSERNPLATHGTSGGASSPDAPPPDPEAVVSAADSSPWTPPPLPTSGSTLVAVALDTSILPPPPGPPSCSACHTEYRSRSRYCMNCCKQLPLPPEPPCTRCNTPYPLWAKCCSNCGQSTRQIAGFVL